MAVTLYHVGRTPNQTQYGLDQFTEHYKASDAADVVLLDAGVPQRGDAHPDYASMFVTDRYCSETGPSSSALDVTYSGTMSGAMPPQKQTTSGAVASATTNTDADIFPSTVTNPLTVQFYAITNTLDFYSTDPADASEPDDPPEVTSLITWDLGFGVQPGYSFPDLVTYFLTKAYVQGIIEPPASVDPVVNDQFYHITRQKTRTLFPYAPPS